MSELAVRDLSVRYGRILAVDDVSASVPHAGALGIVGESGSGKTTLARALVGQLAPDSGEILLGGRPLGARRSRDERRAIQLLPQDPYSSLNPRMTVAGAIGELLRFGRRPGSRAAVRARVSELLETVRLDPGSMDAYPHEFSGGQRQRIALARALAADPDVLVADEPTSALDVSVQSAVIELLAGLQRDLGLTIVCISHDLGVVHELCESVVVMRAGRVVERGGREMFENPAEPYTRELLAAVPRLPGPSSDPSSAPVIGTR
ncbi:ABC transporter ATP-binding protein [Leucobacter sp. CSA1]|uniref:ABC transporter ATP-binding protein n=1 Tax=Leucobacter chromiisoli TaxID=2796471 RepID=A0A934UUH8_9MICO|nr:ABC transporter ATP-binding protein [Leucobacter chromiisoli]MBK0419509.1 ABC transporter ATP-binding protein [Leucobacter chromiisoli]